MSVKSIIKKLEKTIEQRHPNYEAKFYINRKNNYIHLGLDRSLFLFENYKTFLKDIDNFLSSKLNEKFHKVDPPKLIMSTRWKHDYLIRSRHE